MNRQMWTNEKQDKTNSNRGIESEGKKCGLCNMPENTQHILFSCNRYSVEYWEIFSEIISKWCKKDKADHPTFYIHMYNIMYNTEMKSLSKGYRKVASTVVQEIKRDMIYRRFKRCENNNLNNIRYGRHRIIAHMLTIVRKVQRYKEYQGKNTDKIQTLCETLEEEI